MPFHYYNWTDFLSALFAHVPNITSYYHFRFTHDHPGTVYLCEFANTQEKQVVLIKTNATIDKTALPSTLTPSGLSEERQQYLYEHIRPFCDEKYHDETCPQPSSQKPVSYTHLTLPTIYSV